jgi:hypothetical protein
MSWQPLTISSSMETVSQAMPVLRRMSARNKDSPSSYPSARSTAAFLSLMFFTSHLHINQNRSVSQAFSSFWKIHFNILPDQEDSREKYVTMKPGEQK